MGLLDALRLTRAAAHLELGSPWADSSNLSTIVWADLLDADQLPITRAEAMQVPAMARARHLLCSTVARCPIRVARGDQVLPDAEQPAWTYRTDGNVPPFHRLLWTVDDLLFYGWSLWVVDRGKQGQLLAADRLPYELWKWDADGRTVLVADQRVDARDVILIPGPHEGVLQFAARTLRAASKLERAAARHSNNPVPSVELRQTVDVQLTQAEIDDTVTAWVAARAGETGAVAFTPYGLEAHPLGAVPEQLLVEGRNAAAVDTARHVGIPAAMLDATNAGASLTYETTQGRNQQFLDYGVAMYLDAIGARLSMDDVVPRGQRSFLDTAPLTGLLPDDNGPATLD